MPNHITNTIKMECTPDRWEQINREVINSKHEFDFELIIPLDGDRSADLQRETWGTKWNAYYHESRDDSDFVFDTAWNHPRPVIKALSLKYPEVIFKIAYADEDMGSNLGTYTIING